MLRRPLSYVKAKTSLTKNGKRALELNSFGTMPEDRNTFQQIPTDSLALKGLASLAERPRQSSRFRQVN